MTVDLNKGERPTDGPDVIRGTERDDRIRTSGGDIVCAMGGDDIVTRGYVLDRNDIIRGGWGNDILRSDYGNNTMYGGSGDDELSGAHPYTDRRQGGEPGTGGYDRIFGGPGVDTLYSHDHGRVHGRAPDLLDGGEHRPRVGDPCDGTPETTMRNCERMKRWWN